ncbi:MAG: hypothetical protein JSU63_13875 [Phycisphaerales bacterium]|nr:MAG: hypothetical protein JSU63_13875 [Phycisphaerales bacterium]
MGVQRSTIDHLSGVGLHFRGVGVALGLCLALLPSVGQAQSIEWAVSSGGTLYDWVGDIDVDVAGNTYITGMFEGTATFGSITLTAAGERDVFVAKYDAAGNVVWASSAGGALSTGSGRAIAADASGNSYVTGNYEGTVTFGSFTLPDSGDRSDIFVAKYDSSGSVAWVHSFGAPYHDEGTGIDVDAAGNVYMMGNYCCGDLDFGSFTLSAGHHRVFLVKYDADGNALWGQQSEATFLDWGEGVAVDPAGNSYLTGNFEQSTSFGAFTLNSVGDWDVFVAKYDSSGNVLWAISAGGIEADRGRAIGIDAAGNSYITGTFEGTATFGPFTLTADGLDPYVAKFDGSGNVLWARSADVGTGYDIAVHESGISYVTGFFSGEVPGEVLKLLVYDSTGNLLWSDSDGAVGKATAIDSAGSSYVTGGFTHTATFGAFTLTSAGELDVFVAKYGPGACCLASGLCEELGPTDCDAAGGTYVAGVCEGDVDGDGLDGSCGDPCPNDATDDSDGDGLCDSDDPCPLDNPDDTDGDGVCDSDDPCPFDNPDDTDGDGVCDSVDMCPGYDDGLDADSDGMPDDCDDCPLDPGKIEPGICGCGAPDVGDADGDGFLDCIDQCAGVDDGVFGPQCDAAIPTVSTWGLVVLVLLVLTCAKLVFSARRRAGRTG